MANLSKFSERVFFIVKKIPKGKVFTYQEVAKQAGSPKASRAVGNILHRNKDPKIPCHRVIRSDGVAGGYNGLIKNKKKIDILRKEGVAI
jgi:O-6-methylguanine DNA methyltransferase